METKIEQKEGSGMSMIGLVALAILGFFLYKKYSTQKVQLESVRLGQIKSNRLITEQERRILGTIRKRIQ